MLSRAHGAEMTQKIAMPESTADSSATSEASNNVMLWLVAFGFFMETLDSTIVNTALPSMARDLSESPIHMYAVTISYSLTIALLIPASGWVADRFGVRRVFMTAIALFSLGSLSCALSHSLVQLVGSRVLQGLGGSMLLPVGRLAVLRCFPREKFLAAISFVAIPGLIGPLIGPTLGGVLVEAASWHWIFLINLPIGAVGLVATALHMPTLEGATRRAFDWRGYAMLAGFMVMTSLAIEGLSGLRLPTASVLVLAIFGLAALISYGFHATRFPAPLFSLDLFKTRTFAIGLAGNLLSRIGSSGMPFLIPMLLQTCFGFTPSQSGLTMVPTALAAILSKRAVTRVIEKLGYRRFLTINTLLVGGAIASFATMSAIEPIWLRLIRLSIFGMVNSLQFSAMNSLTLKDLDSSGASSGNSLLSMTQMLALSMGVTCAGAVLTIFTDRFGGAGSGADAARAFHATFVVVGAMTCASSWIFLQLSPAQRLRPNAGQPMEMQS